MRLIFQPYQQSLLHQPQSGQHILAQQTDTDIIFYQAYKPSIAVFSVDHQTLGGPDFSLNRMSWIKPNFLWMMFRCGWAAKENQERVLAISITKSTFELLLKQAVHSNFKPGYYQDHQHWRDELTTKDVRLQWDPDHDPFGNKVQRRAIQLGLKGDALQTFITQITSVQDVTDFVKEQKEILDTHGLNALTVPVETIFSTSDEDLNRRIGIDPDPVIFPGHSNT